LSIGVIVFGRGACNTPPDQSREMVGRLRD
jgi:hypothetical protein